MQAGGGYVSCVGCAGGLSGEGGGAWKGISHERNSMNRKPEAGSRRVGEVRCADCWPSRPWGLGSPSSPPPPSSKEHTRDLLCNRKSVQMLTRDLLRPARRWQHQISNDSRAPWRPACSRALGRPPSSGPVGLLLLRPERFVTGVPQAAIGVLCRLINP